MSQKTYQWLTIVLVLVSFVLVENRSYNNGLIFYDLQTYLPYLPPTVSVSRGRGLSSVKYSDKGSIWSTFGQPCECNGNVCGCCAGIKVKQYNFDQKMCANMTFVPAKEEALLEVFLNEKSSAKYGVSARNPSPFCIPVMMGIPMAMCVQMSNIGMQGNNLNMCMDFIVRLATTDLFEMHFQCMRMGLDGVQYLDKDGQPVIPPGNSKTDTTSDYEYYDETADSANEISSHEGEKESQSEIDQLSEGVKDEEEAQAEESMGDDLEEQTDDLIDEHMIEEVDEPNEELAETQNEELEENDNDDLLDKDKEEQVEKEKVENEETENIQEKVDEDNIEKDKQENNVKENQVFEEKVVEEPIAPLLASQSEKSTTVATPFIDKATTAETPTESIDAITATLTTTTTTTSTTEANLLIDVSHNSNEAANATITTATANVENANYNSDNGNDNDEDNEDNENDEEVNGENEADAEGEEEEEEYDETDDEAEAPDMDTSGYSQPIVVPDAVILADTNKTSADTQLPITVNEGDLVAMASATVSDAASSESAVSEESQKTISSDEVSTYVGAPTAAPEVDDTITFYRRRLFG